MRQLGLLDDKPPRSKPRVMMHVIDAGAEAVLFECPRCRHASGWLCYDEGDSVTKLKRGIPCPRCNTEKEEPRQ